MTYIFNESQPIYLQLVEIFKINIFNGNWQAGQKIDSVRNLALEFDVNPNTVQRALTELENMQLAFSQRTAGRFITKDKALIDNLKQEIAKNKTEEFILQMQAIKINNSEIQELIKQSFIELEENKKEV